jgi:hypothetical protein
LSPFFNLGTGVPQVVLQAARDVQGVTGVEEEGVYRIWKSGRIRQHIYGVKAGILKKGVMDRKARRSAYN